MASHAQKTTVFHLYQLWKVLHTSPSSSEWWTLALAAWCPSWDATHSAAPGELPRSPACWLWGEHHHAQTQVLLLVRQAGMPRSTEWVSCHYSGTTSLRKTVGRSSGTRGKTLAGAGDIFHVSYGWPGSKLWSAWDYRAPNCLSFRWTHLTVERHSSKGHQEGLQRTVALAHAPL